MPASYRSRASARAFGTAYALVLRALAELEEAGLVTGTARDARTERTRYAAGPVVMPA